MRKIAIFALPLCLALGACSPLSNKASIRTDKAPAAVGPYSQAISSNGVLFLSGQIPLNKSGVMVDGGIEEQTQQVIENLKAVLEANNMTLENIVSTTVYLRNLDDFQKMNAVYGQHFKNMPPARATVGVSAIPKGALIEISAIAHL